MKIPERLKTFRLQSLKLVNGAGSKKDKHLKECGVIFKGSGYEAIYLSRTRKRIKRFIVKNDKVIYSDSYANL